MRAKPRTAVAKSTQPVQIDCAAERALLSYCECAVTARLVFQLMYPHVHKSCFAVTPAWLHPQKRVQAVHRSGQKVDSLETTLQRASMGPQGDMQAIPYLCRDKRAVPGTLLSNHAMPPREHLVASVAHERIRWLLTACAFANPEQHARG